MQIHLLNNTFWLAVYWCLFICCCRLIIFTIKKLPFTGTKLCEQSVTWIYTCVCIFLSKVACLEYNYIEKIALQHFLSFWNTVRKIELIISLSFFPPCPEMEAGAAISLLLYFKDSQKQKKKSICNNYLPEIFLAWRRFEVLDRTDDSSEFFIIRPVLRWKKELQFPCYLIWRIHKNKKWSICNNY